MISISCIGLSFAANYSHIFDLLSSVSRFIEWPWLNSPLLFGLLKLLEYGLVVDLLDGVHHFVQNLYLQILVAAHVVWVIFFENPSVVVLGPWREQLDILGWLLSHYLFVVENSTALLESECDGLKILQVWLGMVSYDEE